MSVAIIDYKLGNLHSVQSACDFVGINSIITDNPDDILERGESYTVERTEVHTAHTKISVEGYNGKFNSICFIKEEN